MKKIILSLCLICSLLLLNPLSVEAAYGTSGQWYGNLNVLGVTAHARLIEKDDFSYKYNSSTGDITTDQYYGLYEFNFPVRFRLDDMVPGYIYNGKAVTSATFTVQSNGLPADEKLFYGTEVSMDTYSLSDNVRVEFVFADGGNAPRLQFTVYLDNYVASSDTLAFELPMTIRCSTYNNSNSNYVGLLVVNHQNDVDTAGIMNYYTDLRDIPSTDGFFANQNQSIIDELENNTVSINDMKYSLVNTINNAFNNLITNLTTWYNGLISNLNSNFDRLLNQDNTQHQQTINGYQGTGTNDASDTFDQGAEELEEAEDDLTNITNSSFNSYTEDAFDTSVITSLGSSLVYVVTWFTNFWNMGGIFTSIMNVGLALSVAFFILRLRGGN